MFVLHCKVLGQVGPEKFLMEKKVYRQTNRQTNILTEKTKTIYPLYTLYNRRYNKLLVSGLEFTKCLSEKETWKTLSQPALVVRPFWKATSVQKHLLYKFISCITGLDKQNFSS